MQIIKALKQGWERSGLTYAAFGEKVGVSMSSAHKKLNGEQVLTVSDAEVWAKVLKVKISAKLK